MMCKDEWFEVLTGDTFGIAARFIKLGTTNDPLMSADIQTITVNVYEVAGNKRTLVDTNDVDTADVFFDTYQSNPQWLSKEDSTGFNFTTKLTLEDFDKRYHVEAVLVLTNGDPYIERWNIRTI